MKKILPFILVLILFVTSCTDNKKTQEIKPKTTNHENSIVVPDFNSDSAYVYTQKQVEFGPRVPNTSAHDKCAKYLKNKMESLGAKVIVQKAKVRAYNGKWLKIQNIICSYYPEKKDRLLLFAHWDSRPVADHCEDPSRRSEPILGANDGASGIGVLMELGRLLMKSEPKLGVDLIFFDAEDYGTPDNLDLPQEPDTWCLGSQYWAANLHEFGYFPRYGILLDMIGAKNAMFYKEGVSKYYAPSVVRKVWSIADKIGYSNYFVDADGGQITDDHLYVNKIAGIPSIDIIQNDPSTDSHFGAYWHTHNDNMDVIDKNTLKAVGQTLITVIFYEK